MPAGDHGSRPVKCNLRFVVALLYRWFTPDSFRTRVFPDSQLHWCRQPNSSWPMEYTPKEHN